jgi:hypothetical protein
VNGYTISDVDVNIFKYCYYCVCGVGECNTGDGRTTSLNSRLYSLSAIVLLGAISCIVLRYIVR